MNILFGTKKSYLNNTIIKDGYCISIKQARIRSSLIEGETYIKKLTPIKRNTRKYYIYLGVNFCCLGLLAVILMEFNFLAYILYYDDCLMRDGATHLMIDSSDETQIIQPIQKEPCPISKTDRTQIFFKNKLLRYDFSPINRWYQTAQLFQNDTLCNKIIELYGKGIFCWIFEYQKLYVIFGERTNVRFFNQFKYQYEFLFNKVAFFIILPNEILNKLSVFMLKQFGKNEAIINLMSKLTYWMKSLTSPIMYLSYFTCIIWILDGFFIHTLGCLAFDFLLIYLNYSFYNERVSQIQGDVVKRNQQIQKIKVFRNKNFSDYQMIDQDDLTPGDIFALNENSIVPCDCIIIKGSCMVNEYIITGSTISSSKTKLQKNEIPFNLQTSSHNICFGGTKIVLLNKNEKYQNVLALCYGVGFYSYKGQMLRNVIYPKPKSQIHFYELFNMIQKFTFVGFFFLVIKLITMIFQSNTLNQYLMMIANYFIYCVPPYLIIIIEWPQMLALYRLRQKQIQGSHLNAIMDAGKCRTFCFDKTGCLTQENIDVMGIMPVKGDIITDRNLFLQNDIYVQCCATCHILAIINNEIVGQNLEKKMFQYTGWKMERFGDVYQVFNDKGTKLNILKSFPFQHGKYIRSSVIIQNDNTNEMMVICKGQPHVIKDLCLQSSIPADYEDRLQTISDLGYRIVSLSYRKFDHKNKQILHKIQRDDIECKLEFIGFLILKNNLKVDTLSCIDLLQQANINIKIITGDLIYNAVTCGRDIGIIPQNKGVLIIDSNEKMTAYQQINLKYLKPNVMKKEEEIDHKQILDKIDEINRLGVETESQQKIRRSMQFRLITDLYKHGLKCEFAITGNFQKHFLNLNYNISDFQDEILDIFKLTKIFSSQSPIQKSIIIQLYQSQNVTIGMIGDGANDSSAIRQSDVGVSFTNNESSLASHFSSQNKDLNCIVQILLEGRNLLNINTGVLLFFFTIQFSRFVQLFFLSIRNQDFNSQQYIFSAFFTNVFIFVIIGKFRPQKILTESIPISSFKDPLIYYTLLGNFSVLIVANFVLFLLCHFIYEDKYSAQQQIGGTNLTTVLFYANNSFNIAFKFANHVSHPFTETIFENRYVFTYMLLILLFINLVFLMDTPFVDFGFSTQMNLQFKIIIFGIVQLFCLIFITFQQFFIQKYVIPIQMKIQRHKDQELKRKQTLQLEKKYSSVQNQEQSKKKSQNHSEIRKSIQH